MSTTVESQLEWRVTDEGLTPILISGKREIKVAWAPQPGSQVALLSCPVPEAMIEGNRGGGKTDDLIFDFAQDCGKGWGQEWRGIIFRRTYPELQDVIDKCLKWIPRIWPEARYNRSEHFWTWPDGEQLFLRHFRTEQDYWSYHGHNYPYIAWEELCTWPDDKCYTKMFSCNRSSAVGIPIKVRATANPYGVGHNWVKKRFGLPLKPGVTRGPVMRNIRDKHGDLLPDRVAIHSHLEENKVLLHAQPDYLTKIRAAARNDAEYRAWVHGDWNIVAGGMFDDLWDESVHMVPNFPLALMPKSWYVNRAYDHGDSAPFSVGWWAESSGETFIWQGKEYGLVPGDLFRIAEWYGATEEPNEGLSMPPVDIAQGILDREADLGLKGRVRRGPADTNIFDDRPGHPNISTDMESRGVYWDRADKGSGSRVQGWRQLRNRLKAAAAYPREEPGLFACERCAKYRELLPVLPRSHKNLDDVNTDSEDHIGDEVRYRLRHKRIVVQTGVWR